MKLVKAPVPYEGKGKSLFLAGGIKGGPKWQDQLIGLLKDEDVALLNPRRAKPPKNTVTVREQIRWEHDHLRVADAVSFWFPKETPCPITLYELGAWSMSKKRIFVGVHPQYAKRLDVETQTALARPEVMIVYSLEDLAEQIRDWLRER